jgi:hypothetical protein
MSDQFTPDKGLATVRSEHIRLLTSIFFVDAVDLSVNRRRSCRQRQWMNHASVHTEQTRKSILLVHVHLNMYQQYEVFTAVTMKNVVFWDIKTKFVPHRRHITFLLQAQPVNAMVFTAVTKKNVVFWDIKTTFVPNRRQITSPLQSPAS